MAGEFEIYGKILHNLRVFNEARKIGFEYIVNPQSGELHRMNSDFLDSHNLHVANLENFIGLVNVGLIQIHRFADGAVIPVYDLDSGELIGSYPLNKCQHCRWW